MPRLVVSQVVIILCLVLTDAMAAVNTDAWQSAFFAVTIATVVVINIMVAIFQVRKESILELGLNHVFKK